MYIFISKDPPPHQDNQYLLCNRRFDGRYYYNFVQPGYFCKYTRVYKNCHSITYYNKAYCTIKEYL